MFGWFSRASDARLSIESLAETGCAPTFSRENLQRDEPVERRLARLIDSSHAAPAEERKNFKLGKQPRNILQCWRFKWSPSRLPFVALSLSKHARDKVRPNLPSEARPHIADTLSHHARSHLEVFVDTFIRSKRENLLQRKLREGTSFSLYPGPRSDNL